MSSKVVIALSVVVIIAIIAIVAFVGVGITANVIRNAPLFKVVSQVKVLNFVTCTVQNVGNSPGNAQVTAYVDGQSQSRSVTLGVYGMEAVVFTFDISKVFSLSYSCSV